MATRKNNLSQAQQSRNIIKLQEDIDKMGKKAKQNIHNYRKMQYNVKPNINKSVKLIDICERVNSLRSKNRIKKEQEISLENKLKYLAIERQRKTKTVELAKRKYQHIVEVRNQKTKQKQYLKNRLQINNSLYEKQINQKVTKIKNEKQKTSQSVKSFISANSSEADNIRKIKMSNYSLINKQRSKTLEVNKQKVKQIQSKLNFTKLKLQSLQVSRKQQAKQQYKAKVFKEFTTFQQRQRKNSLLLDKLKKQAKKMRWQRQKLADQLKDYQQILELPKYLPKTSRTVKNMEHEFSKSFYLTAANTSR